jgi:hypothetical protein
MSWNPLLEPSYPDAVAIDAIETLIVPRSVDLGGFEVRRALPATQRQMIGPFIFFDHVRPAEIPAGRGADVRPIPISGSRPSPICFSAMFSIGTAWGQTRSSVPATSGRELEAGKSN